MKLYWVGMLFTVLVRCLVHKPVRPYAYVRTASQPINCQSSSNVQVCDKNLFKTTKQLDDVITVTKLWQNFNLVWKFCQSSIFLTSVNRSKPTSGTRVSWMLTPNFKLNSPYKMTVTLKVIAYYHFVWIRSNTSSLKCKWRENFYCPVWKIGVYRFLISSLVPELLMLKDL